MTIGPAIRAIRKRWPVLVGVLLFVMGCTEIYSAKLTPRYLANATLSMRRSPLNELRAFENPVGREIEETIFRKIENADYEITSRVAKSIGMGDADRAGRLLTPSISVSFDNHTGILRVSATHSDPRLTAKLAGAYSEAVAEYAPRKRREIVAELKSYLTERLTEAVETKPELEKSMEYLTHYEAIEPPTLTVVSDDEPHAFLIYPNRSMHRSIAISVGLLLGLAVVLVIETESLEKSPGD